MPASYLHPGVYVEEIPSGVKPIEGVGTSTAIFMGFTVKGPVGEPTLIKKWDDYVTRFGGYRDTEDDPKGDQMAYSVAAFFQNGGTQAYIARLAKKDTKDKPLTEAAGRQQVPNDASRAFVVAATNEGQWANGYIVQLTTMATAGKYVVMIGQYDPRGAFTMLERFDDVSFDKDSPRFIESVINGFSENVRIAVMTPAEATTTVPQLARSYAVGTSESGPIATADLDFSDVDDAERCLEIELDGDTSITVQLEKKKYSGDLAALAGAIQSKVREGSDPVSARGRFSASVNWQKGTILLCSNSAADTPAVVVTGTAAAKCQLGSANNGTERNGKTNSDARFVSGPIELAGGGNGDLPVSAHYDELLGKLTKYRDINIVCLPGQDWSGAGRPIIEKAISHAEAMRDRMVILDPPSDVELNNERSVADLTLSTSTYAVTYYPWINAANFHYDGDARPGLPETVLVAPSGYAAGMWARIDSRRGVWKAPAGVETQLSGVASLTKPVEDAEQDALNPLGVNCLRKLPGFGAVIWGARTLSTKANPEWRYVPVRRTAIFIERSIYNGIQWAVFEGNDHLLWSSLRANIASFMDGLFRAGAFQGQKASDAYYVRCGLGDTMTQDDIDRGQVIVIVGFAPLKPAEFVIIRLQQKVNQQ